MLCDSQIPASAIARPQQTMLPVNAKSQPSALLSFMGTLFGKILTWAGGLSAVTALYLFFASSISVTPGEPLNGEALSAPFTITNTSQFLTVRNVTPGCAVTENWGKFQHTKDMVNRNYGPTIREIDAGGYDTIYCENSVTSPDQTANADVTIRVDYQDFFRKRSYYARFITRAKNDGSVVWVHYGLREEKPNFDRHP
jgi:hypothetical protein